MFKPKSPLLRYALPLVALLIAGGAVKHFFFQEEAKPAFVTATAALADLEQSVLATGTLQAFKQVSVGSQVSGQVKSLKVALGEKVKKGQLVAEIDSMTQQNNLRNTQAALANVQAQLVAKQAALKQNEFTFRRERELLAADASSRASFEAAEAAFNTARADVNATRAQIAQAEIAANTAQINLGYTKIVAPMDGVVVALVAQEGQTVNANQSTPTIIKLATLDTITVKSQISEADVVRVKPGQKVYFTILGAPEQRYYTTVRAVEPAPDSILADTDASAAAGNGGAAATAIYYNGLLDVPNADGSLRISMTAQVYIVLSEARQVLTIPSSALGERDRQGMTTVRVVDAQGKAVPRQVKVGINNNVNAQILEGLAAGDEVVVSEAPAGGPEAASMRRPVRMRL